MPGAERALDLLNLLLSDVRYGLGAYLGVSLLTEHRWDAAEIGLALSFGGFVGLLSQTPIGLQVDVFIVVFAGYNAAFLILAMIAALGPVVFWLAMPETRDAPAHGEL